MENYTGYIRSVGSFTIMVHVFACMWIYVGALDGQWMSEEEKLFQDKGKTYANSLYFITTTMTSVGYGDINGFDQHVNTLLVIIFTQIFGILGFTIVKMFVFSAYKEPTLQEILKKTKEDTEEMLFRIDQLKSDEIPPKLYDDAMSYMGTLVRFSIYESFAGNSFYRELRPQL